MNKILSETKMNLRIEAPEIKSENNEESNSDNIKSSRIDQLINELNSAVRPPQELSANDVVIRTMYLVSDQVNQYSGKFDLSELEIIARLCVDAPVMIGHRKDKLPIGRVFKAELVKRDNENWVKVYFYWLRDVTGSETMTGNIDGGIYKECSLGFVYTKAECTQCGNDIRECGHHRVHKTALRKDSEKPKPMFSYKGTQRILEISLVYRGATNNTKISNDLGLNVAVSDTNNHKFVSDSVISAEDKKDWLSQLSIRRKRIILPSQIRSANSGSERNENNEVKLALPLYDGLALVLARRNDTILVMRDDMIDAPESVCEYIRKQVELPEGEFALYGRLVGMRGKERRSLSELIRFLRNEGGPVRYARFYALATLSHNGRVVSSEEELLATRIFNSSASKSRYLSFPKAIGPSKSALLESCETISVDEECNLSITRFSEALEFAHSLTESEVAQGKVIISVTEKKQARELHIQLKHTKSSQGQSLRSVLIRGAGIELRDGAMSLTDGKIVADLYDFMTPEDTLNLETTIAEKQSERAERPAQALCLALYERLTQPGVLVRATSQEIGALSGTNNAEITIESEVPCQKPLRVRIIRLLNSNKSQVALIRVNDTQENQLAVAA